MALNLKNPQTERLARQLAAATGETVTAAITVAVRERLDRLTANAGQNSAARIRDIAADAAGRWVEPYRSADHGALLYDEAGLPQ
jgi:antitoxin VapB